MAKAKFPCRTEELTVISRMIYNSLNRDRTLIAVTLPKYNPLFMTSFDAKIVAVEALVFPAMLLAELKVITARLYANMATMRPKMNEVESWVITAAPNLTIAPKDFGYRQVRKELNGDTEGLVNELTYLINNMNVAQNQTALTAAAVGMPAGYTASLATLRDAIRDDNLAQESKIQQRSSLVSSNMNVLNDLWTEFDSPVIGDGKRWAKVNDTSKVNDYSAASLIRNIRQEQLKSKVLGTTKDNNGVSLNGVKLKLIPTLGGLGKSTTSKNGKYEMKSLVSQDYILTGVLAGYKDFSVGVTVITGQTVVVDVVMVRL